ncbi:MAG: lamin tail domain-containing protein [Pyrinomonadaceae bacterium]|nr:lamin tail domain-containing protein [Pyrinomonadaceae bacterium]
MLRASILTALSLILVTTSVALFTPRSTGSSALPRAASRAASSQNPVRRVTNTREEVINLNPSLSGDGRIVAFETTGDLAGMGSGHGFRAIRAELSLGQPVFAQIGVSRAVTPAVSQDGSRVAFASTEDLVGTHPDRNSEIFLFDGVAVSQITNTTPADISSRVRDGNFQPSITDDGRVIAFSSNRNLTGLNEDHNFEVLTIDTTTGVIAQITSSVEIVGATEAKISGDGSHVAFVRYAGQSQGNTRDLILYDRIGARTVTAATGRVGLSMAYGRAISDNGSRVVYSAEIATNQSQVFLFDERSGATMQITALSARADDVPLHPAISGDGKRVAFATRRNVIGGNNDRSVELYVYDTPTGQITKLTEAPASATAEVISSLNDDGSLAAFSFPRVISGSVSSNDFADNSEIYITTIDPRPAFGTIMVFNGAAHGNEPGTEQTIAPDSIAVAKGTALASQTLQAERSVSGQFPLSLAGTSALVNGRTARILFISPTQVNFVVPPETDPGAAEVLVKNSEGFQSRSNVTIVPSAPGLFSAAGDGRGEGVILNADTLQSGPFDPTSGQLRLVVFATGARGSSELSASIAGRSLPLESIHRSTDLPGLDELHILIPSDLRGAGTVNLSVSAGTRASNGVDLTLSGSFVRDILINEFLADPADGLAGDANHDGVRDSSDDEFIELVNTTGRDLDLNAYQLRTRGPGAINDIVRHRFAEGTILAAGTALVVFGGGNLDHTDVAFGGARIYKASTGGLSLLNSGGVITLRDSAGTIITSLSYGGSTGLRGDANESLTRSPDVTGSFRLHHTVPEGEGRLFSPGVRVNGTAFQPLPAIANVVVSPASTSLAAGAEIWFTARAFDQNGQELSDVIFGWQSNDVSVGTVDRLGLVKAVAAGTAQITASARGVHSAPAVLMVTTPSPSPSPGPSPTPTPGPTPSPSPSPSPTPAQLIVISEFRTRGPGGASDEFIELYNNSDATVDIGRWKIKGSSNAGGITTRLTISTGVLLPARSHFLATNSGGYSGSIAGDQNYTSGFANDGGLALTLPNDAIVDQIGMSQGSAFREGMHLAPLTSDANQSYERKPGGSPGTTQDSEDNFNDFQLIAPSNPQGLSGGATPSPSPSPSPSVSPTATPTPLPSPSPSPTPSPTPIPLIVISEFRTRGPAGANDEFVELYNNGDTPVEVGGWKIKGSSNAGTVSTRLSISAGAVIPARGHLLVTNSGGYSGSVLGDQRFTSGIANDGGIALTLPNDTVVDQVGMSSGSAFREGMHLAPLPSNANQSYERKPGGLNGSSQDTTDNFNDFQLLSPSDPQNLSANPTPGPSPTPGPTPSPSPSPTPSPVPTPTPLPSPSPTPTPSPSPTPSTRVLISQIYGGGGNSGAPFRNDFIELFNAGSSSISLAGWSVQYANSTGTSWSVTNLTPVSLAPGQYYLIQESSGGSSGASLPPADATGVIAMAATAGKVALVNVSTALSGTCPADETVMDFVGYGGAASCFRGVGPTAAPSNATSVSRNSNGCTDTLNNASDFAAGVPNPRNIDTAISPCTAASRIDFSNVRTPWRNLVELLMDSPP